MKKILGLLLSLSLLVSPCSFYTIGTQQIFANTSDWSSEFFARGEEVGLIPSSLSQSKKSYITRKNFSEIAINFYSLYTGNPAVSINISPFMDEKSPKIVKAYELGIVNGYDDKTFKPNDYITREQMAVMIFNTLKACNDNFDIETDLKIDFSDSSEISEYAENAIKYLEKEKILSGIGGNFSPNEKVTVEQAVCAFVNAYNLFVGKSFKIGKNDVIINEGKESVSSKFGTPDRIDPTEYSGEKFVYNSNPENFIIIGFKDNKVVEMISNAPTMEYYGYNINSTINDCSLNSIAKVISPTLVTFVDNKVTAYMYGDKFDKKIDLIQIKSNSLNPSSVISDDTISVLKNEIADLIMVKRYKEKLNPITKNEILSGISQEHSDNMQLNNYTDYTNSDGLTPFIRLSDSGINYNSAGEIICTSKDSIGAYTYFMDSLGTRSVILNPEYSDYGIGVSRKGLNYYITVDFIEKI